MSDWLWHLLNDPMRDNPWSLLLLIVILVTAGILMWRRP